MQYKIKKKEARVQFNTSQNTIEYKILVFPYVPLKTCSLMHHLLL